MPFKEPQIPSQPEEIKREKGEEEKKEKKIEEKKQAFQELGFQGKESLEYLTKYFKKETLLLKIESLKRTGIQDPIKAIEKHPPLAGYDIERVINNLKNAGIQDPIKAINKFPPLAGLDIERVRSRIRFLDRLTKLYRLQGISGTEIGENFPPLFGYHLQRIHFYCRLLKTMGEGEKIPLSGQELFKKGKNLLSKNPYLVFYFLNERRPQNFSQLSRIISEIRRLSRTEKRRIISQTQERISQLLENLKESLEPYKNEFLRKLAWHLKRYLEESKKKSSQTYEKSKSNR